MRGIRLFNFLYLLTLVTLATSRSVPNTNHGAITSYILPILNSLKAIFEAYVDLTSRAISHNNSSLPSIHPRHSSVPYCVWLDKTQSTPCQFRITPNYDTWGVYTDEDRLWNAQEAYHALHPDYNAAGSLKPPRIFTIPALVFNALGSLPKAFADMLPVEKRDDWYAKDGTEKHFPCRWWVGPNYKEDLFYTARYWDANSLNTALNDAKSKHLARNSLKYPQEFAVSRLAFNASASLPGALAETTMAAPTNLVFGSNSTTLRKGPRTCNYLNENQTLPCVWYGETFTDENVLWNVQYMCGKDGLCKFSAGSSSKPPRAFALPGLIFNILRSVHGVLAGTTPLGKRQEYQVCDWLRQSQEFPCSWRATPNNLWRNFNTLKDLNAARLGQTKEFRPSREPKRATSPEWSSLRNNIMGSVLDATKTSLSRRQTTVAIPTPTSTDIRQCDFIVQNQALPCVWDFPGLVRDRVFADAEKLYQYQAGRSQSWTDRSGTNDSTQVWRGGDKAKRQDRALSERDIPLCKWLNDSQPFPCRWNDPDIDDPNQIWNAPGDLFNHQQGYGDKHNLYMGAASGLRPPSVFALPVTAMRALGSIPRAMAAAIPSLAKRVDTTLMVANREIKASQAPLQSQGKETWCGLPLIWTYPCSWNAEDPHLPGVFVPYVFCKWIVLMPTNMIISLAEPFGLLTSKADSIAKRSLDNPLAPLEQQGSNSSHLANSRFSQKSSTPLDFENQARQGDGLFPTPTTNGTEVPTKTKRGWCLIPFLMFYPCWTESPTATEDRYSCVTPHGWKYWQTFPCDTQGIEVQYQNSASNVDPPKVFGAPKVIITFVMRVAKTVTNQVASAASLVQKELKTRSRTEDGGKKHKRDCGGESTGAGGFQCSAATSLTLPRIFTFPTVVFNLIARVPSAIAAAALSFEDATNLTEISEVLEAILDGDALPSATETLGARKTICVSNGYNDATACFSDKSAASSLSIPRIFTFPIAVFNVVARIPGVLAAAIALPESSTLSRLGSKGLSSTPDADGTSEVHNERNTPELCVWDGIAGMTVCHPYQRDLNLNDVSSALGADLDPIELIQRATASTTPTKSTIQR
ncbi:uncharacterized protein PAC_00914 [Phialocephala subalpina]|uniref:Uncharacterized protein n=1 Tax=Phialocephala subalpina TaxID=576137 RepID=A0A1L7WE87_9HELO|nr:uncharacterized protein PAC_00914 [Phialocephala subalpina]